jgi:predicted ribosome quality control (RQC) complex YloA/Tae2 family protein
LAEEEQKYKQYANLILANLYQIKPYDTKLNTYDFEGNEISIKLPKNIKVNRMSDYFFNLAKRAKNKAKNIHIEKENLESKKAFYDNIYYALEQAKEPYELELLVPKRAKSQRKKEKLKEGELFWIEDYKVLVGRNSNENQKLLAIAKANDLWMHIRDIPSSHVIIKTDKQNLPESVIQAAAKLCVDFSVKNPGDYEVDYTKRKFVKTQEGSNVLYNKYDTIRITKEGVEIRV